MSSAIAEIVVPGAPAPALALYRVSQQHLAPVPAPASGEEAPAKAAELARYLDGEYGALKNEVRAVLRGPDFAHHYDLDRKSHCELTWRRLEQIVKHGWGAEVFPDASGRNDIPRFLAIFETLGFYDANLVIKFGLQFGLFGGAVFFLGTKQHHDLYLPRVASLDLVGCYAMTEIGHGSDTHRLETVARYDVETDQFVIHSPTPTARKQFIGNAGMHARMAVVFAQLEVAGKRPGVFGFLVPIRDAGGNLCEGVTSGDTGPKIGLHGIDNGWLCFEHVRVPRANLLDRFGSVTREGIYASKCANPTSRVQRAMSGGRVAVAWASLSAAKTGLTIAIRYAAERGQFGREEEQIILDYPLHQRRLFPRLAAAYSMDALLKHVSELSRANADMADPRFEEVTALVKAYVTWNAGETLQVCREACGGQGYLARNRIGVLRADIDPMTTLEGDNTLLYLFAAKARLKRFRDEDLGVAGWVVLRLVHILRERAALAVRSRICAGTLLRDPTFLLRMLRYRETALLWKTARRLSAAKALGDGADYQTPLMTLSQAIVERMAFECFSHAISTSPLRARAPLALLRNLYGLSCIAGNAAWYQGEDLTAPGDIERIETLVAALCYELRPHALSLVHAFSIPEEHLGDLITRRETEEV